MMHDADAHGDVDADAAADADANAYAVDDEDDTVGPAAVLVDDARPVVATVDADADTPMPARRDRR